MGVLTESASKTDGGGLMPSVNRCAIAGDIGCSGAEESVMDVLQRARMVIAVTFGIWLHADDRRLTGTERGKS